MSTAEVWTGEDGDFDMVEFYNNIVKDFDRNADDADIEWIDETLDWWKAYAVDALLFCLYLSLLTVRHVLKKSPNRISNAIQRGTLAPPDNTRDRMAAARQERRAQRDAAHIGGNTTQ